MKGIKPVDASESGDPKGIYALDVGYGGLKPHLSKSQKVFESAEWLHCAICTKGLPTSGAMTLVCPNSSCNALAHIECLSTSFLQAGRNKDAIVPTSGNCPGCGTKHQWIDLVKELSLRMRGEKEVAALFKKRRRVKKQGADAVVDEAIVDDASDASDDEDEEMDDLPVPEGEDEWHELPESSDDEVEELPQVQSGPSPVFKRAGLKGKEPATPKSEPVIEDSDWDDAAVLT